MSKDFDVNDFADSFSDSDFSSVPELTEDTGSIGHDVDLNIDSSIDDGPDMDLDMSM